MPIESNFVVNTDARTLRLEHEKLQIEWNWTEAGAAACRSFVDRSADTEWIDPAFVSPLFVASYKPIPFPITMEVPKNVVSRAASRIDAPVVWRDSGAARVSWSIAADQAPLAFTWHAEVLDGHAVIRQWIEVTNTGEETIELSRVPVFNWAFGAANGDLFSHAGLGRRNYERRWEWPDWFTWQSMKLGSGVAGVVDSGFRAAATWLALAPPAGGPSLYFGWETNGDAACDYGDLHGDGGLWVECSIGPNYHLAPGQTFTGPAGFTGVANGDLDEVSFRCHRFVEDRLSWKVDDERFPYVAFNSWGYETEIDEEIILHSFDVCKQLGIELFVVDFGWEDPDWNPLASIFPNGLAPIADAAHEAGMLFGVHLAFGNVSNLSTMYREHPEWAYGPGQWAYRREGEVYGLTLANPDTRDWIVDKMVQIADENKLDYFLTDHYLWGWTNPDVQAMHATDDYMTIVEGYDDVIARFRALRPHIQIEHCDNGMALPTYKMVQQHATSIGADAAGTLWERVHKYRFSRVLPPRFMDAYVCDRPLPGEYVGTGLTDYDYRSHLFGGPMILMTNIMKMEPGSEDWQALDRNIKLFKRIRKNVLDGKVLHLLEPQPLQQVGRRWDGWDAIGSYHEPSDSAVIMAFRLGGEIDERVIPIHGLNPNSTYRITYEDRPDTASIGGAELMANGLLLSLPEEYTDSNGMKRACDVVFLTGE
jgi:hypothetical protein